MAQEKDKKNPDDFNYKEERDFFNGKPCMIFNLDEEVLPEEREGEENSPKQSSDSSSGSEESQEKDNNQAQELSVNNIVDESIKERTERRYRSLLEEENRAKFIKNDVTYQEAKSRKAGQDVVISAFCKRYEKCHFEAREVIKRQFKEEKPAIKIILEMLDDVDKDPFEALKAFPDSEDFFFEPSSRPVPFYDNFQGKKLLTLAKKFFLKAMVMDMVTVNGKFLPVGRINKAFDSKPAVIIHLDSFSLWVTPRFEHSGDLVPCLGDHQEDLEL
jgi:hypothetical protein